MSVHGARAAMWEHDFPALGSSALFEGVPRKGYDQTKFPLKIQAAEQCYLLCVTVRFL